MIHKLEINLRKIETDTTENSNRLVTEREKCKLRENLRKITTHINKHTETET